MQRMAGYSIHEVLGEGAYGRVFAAIDSMGVPVAIKVLTDSTSIVSLQREILAVAALHHPHIVRVFDFGSLPDDDLGPQGTPFLVMERCSGGCLADHEFATFEAVQGVLAKVLSALAHAHAAGLVHRDLKLTNVLFATDADLRPGLRLADFGLASAPQLGAGVGTPLYMPPEQHETNTDQVGPWTDLYALGVLAWRLVAEGPWTTRFRTELFHLKTQERTVPFEPRMPVPDGFEAWCRTLLSARWESRYLTAAAASTALHELGHTKIDGWDTGSLTREEQPTELASTTVGAWRDAAPSPRPAATTAGTPRTPTFLPDSTSAALTRAGAALLRLRDPPVTGRRSEQLQIWSRFAEARRAPRFGHVRIGGAEESGRRCLAAWTARATHIEAGAFTLWLDDIPPPLTLIARLLFLRRRGVSDVVRRLQRLEVATAPALRALEGIALENPTGATATRLVLRVLGAIARRHPVVVVCTDTDGHHERRRWVQIATDLQEPIFIVETCAEGDLALPRLARGQLARMVEAWAPLHWETTRSLLDEADGLPGRLVSTVRAATLDATPEGLRRTDPSPRFDVKGWSEEDLQAATAVGLLGPIVRAEAFAQVVGESPVPARLVRLGLLRAEPTGWTLSPGTRELLAASRPTRLLLDRCSAALDLTGQHSQAVERALEAGLAKRATAIFLTHCLDGRTVEELEAFHDRLDESILREDVQGRIRAEQVELALRTRHPHAVRLSEDALTMSKTLRWWITAGKIAERRWNFLRTPIREAIELFDKAEVTSDRDWYLSSCWMHVAIQEPTREHWDLALHHAKQSGQTDRIEATAAMHACKFEGDTAAAVRHQEAAVLAVRRIEQRVSGLMYLQHFLLQDRQWQRAIEVGEEGRAWCDLSSNRQYLLFLWLNAALAHAKLGDWSAAHDQAAHALGLPRHPPSTDIARLICAIHRAREGDPLPAARLVPELTQTFAQLFDSEDADLGWLLRQLARFVDFEVPQIG